MNGGATSTALEAFVRLGVLDAERAAALASRMPAPWWLAALQAVAAWFASLLIIGSFFAPLYFLFEGAIGRVVAGVVLLAAAIWLFGRKHLFTEQMGLAFSLAGQALVIAEIAGVVADPWAAGSLVSIAGMLLAAGMILPYSTPLHRTVCALLVWTHCGVLIGRGSALSVYAVALVALAVAMWLHRARWSTSRYAAQTKALLHAGTLSALVGAWVMSHEATRMALQSVGAVTAWWPTLYAAGVSLVLLTAVGWLTRAAAPWVRVWCMLTAGLYCLAAWNAPGLMTSAAILLAVFQACHRPWIALALLAALLYLGEFYYSLHISLLAKSGTLAATGLLLLGLRAVLRRAA